MAGLWKTAGLKVAPARLVGHCVTQVFFDGGWRLFDGDMHSMYLLRDNETIAGEQDLVRDHDLIKRTHTQGILRPQGRAGDEWEASIYVFEGDVTGDRSADAAPSMNMTLRPGEAIVWRWGHTEPVKYFGSPTHKFSERICNGLWEYRPDLAKATWQKGADRAENIVSSDEGLQAEPGKTGMVSWSIRCPYVIVGGKLDVEGTAANFEISWDGKTWENAGKDLDAFFPPMGAARYSYQLRCRLEGAERLKSLKIANDLQMAPLSLPEMAIGENHFTYTDESPVTEAAVRQVQITHKWVERSASAPPAAPAAPIRPRHQGEVEGTNVVFQWQSATDKDGDKIADYHFELSARPDMKWPLSMSFARLISRTSDAGLARYTLSAAGELNPDRQYYWHVRAKDEHGVWGPWSETWSFVARGPAPPLGVAVHFDPEQNLGTLRWAANPLGRRPAAYRIYASDEKGFTVSDQPFRALTGIYNASKKAAKETSTDFPANFLIETKATELAVVGADAVLDGANKAFYRVVAVDQAGNRSGPSDYAAAPRPIIYSKPVAQARIGKEYHYDVRSTGSLGDLRTRVVDGREVMNYWDVEKPRFELEKAPPWLRIDKTTGRLSGKADRAGRSEVVFTVTLERERRKLDPAALQWGIEKSVDNGMETVGTAKQSFVIETRP
jgi:hypothetical protein